MVTPETHSSLYSRPLQVGLGVAAAAQTDLQALVRDTAQFATLVARARRSLDHDPRLTRGYLDQLSAMVSGVDAACVSGYLPARPITALDLDLVKGGLASWQLRRVTEYIEANLAEAIVTEDLAAVARFSVGHFARAFKVTVGETPHAYIIRQRVRWAQRLMVESQDSLSQIACACGLTDQAHLTRLFRRILGTTPLSWRRTWQSGA